MRVRFKSRVLVVAAGLVALLIPICSGAQPKRGCTVKEVCKAVEGLEAQVGPLPADPKLYLKYRYDQTDTLSSDLLKRLNDLDTLVSKLQTRVNQLDTEVAVLKKQVAEHHH